MRTGHSKLGDYFVSSRAKGREGLPLMSVTLNNGLVVRDSLDRRTATSLDPSEHLLVKEGDIAYNMMRVWQGALGKASSDGLVSPAYVVLRPRDGVDSKYSEYLFKTPRMIYLFWAYSYGLTKDRLRLYPNDFKKIPANLPKYSIQRKVSEILSVWDEAIEVTGRLIESESKRKKSLMQQLLTGERRLPGFYGGWRPVSLGKLGGFIKGSGIKSSDVSNSGLPCIRYGEIYSHYGDSADELISKIPKEISEKSRRIYKGDLLFSISGETREEIGKCVAYVGEDEAFAGGDIAILRQSGNCSKFLGCLMNHESVVKQKFRLGQGNSVVHISKESLASIQIKLPEIGEQEAIAKVLSAADAEIETLQQRLDCLRQEKRALMQQLLTGKRRVKVEEEAVA